MMPSAQNSRFIAASIILEDLDSQARVHIYSVYGDIANDIERSLQPKGAGRSSG